LNIEVSLRSIRSKKDHTHNKANKTGIDFNQRFSMIDTSTPNHQNHSQNIFNGLPTTNAPPTQTTRPNFMSNSSFLPGQATLTERFSTKSFDNTNSNPNAIRPKITQDSNQKTPNSQIQDLTKGYIASKIFPHKKIQRPQTPVPVLKKAWKKWERLH
jgi:hypothetical protein